MTTYIPAVGGCIHGAVIGAASGFAWGFGKSVVKQLVSSCLQVDLGGWFRMMPNSERIYVSPNEIRGIKESIFLRRN